jgi:hypothetical protein
VLQEIRDAILAGRMKPSEQLPEAALARTFGTGRSAIREALRQLVQDVPLSRYEELAAGDILFIDSSHVAKAGSDVCWLLLCVLPRLASGVVVHLHDIFWPFEYPDAWLREHRDWTEDYLLNAFLSGNPGWEILWFSSWIWRCHPEVVPGHLRAEDPGSIWLRKRG